MAQVKSFSDNYKSIKKTVNSQKRLIRDATGDLKGHLATNTFMGNFFQKQTVSKLKTMDPDTKAFRKTAQNMKLNAWTKGGLAVVGAGIVGSKFASALYDKGKNFNLKVEAFGTRGQDAAGMLGQAGLEGLKFRSLKNKKYI